MESYKTQHKLVMIINGSAAWYEGEGQNPEPNVVKNFVSYMEQYRIVPIIYLVDPAFKDPYPIDIKRFQQYPPNVIVVPETIEKFYDDHPDLVNKKYPIAYVTPFSLGIGTIVPHSDNINNPNRLYYVELKQKIFNPFEIIKMGNYDIKTNTFNRNIYNLSKGGKLPLKLQNSREVVDMTQYDARELFYEILLKLNRAEAFSYGKYSIGKSIHDIGILPFIKSNYPEYYNEFKYHLNPSVIEKIVIDLIKKFEPYLTIKRIPRYDPITNSNVVRDYDFH